MPHLTLGRPKTAVVLFLFLLLLASIQPAGGGSVSFFQLIFAFRAYFPLSFLEFIEFKQNVRMSEVRCDSQVACCCWPFLPGCHVVSESRQPSEAIGRHEAGAAVRSWRSF